MSLTTFPCKFCRAELNHSNCIGQLAVCSHCHSSFAFNETPRKAVSQKAKVSVAIALMLTLGFGARAMGLFEDDQAKLAKTVAQLPLESALILRKECAIKGNTECVRLVYKRLCELDPNDISYQANYAFTLTTLKRHSEALPIYEKLVAEGQGTYDLMAYYATSLDAVGETEKAIDWYEKSLAVFPNLVDVTQKLSIALTKSKRPYEAISLLESFIAKFPDSAGTLKGNLVSIQSQVQKLPPSEPSPKLRLVTLRGSHYFLPIQIFAGAAPVSFLVDTGATDLVMKTSDFVRAFPESRASAKPARAVLADGRRVTAYAAIVPAIQVGPWKLKNVSVFYCDQCVSLAGMSILSRFSVKTMPNGHLETMELTLAR